MPDPVRETKRGGQENIRRGSSFDQVSREFNAAGTGPPNRASTPRLLTMVHIARVDVGARSEQQIDDLA